MDGISTPEISSQSMEALTPRLIDSLSSTLISARDARLNIGNIGNPEQNKDIQASIKSQVEALNGLTIDEAAILGTLKLSSMEEQRFRYDPADELNKNIDEKAKEAMVLKQLDFEAVLREGRQDLFKQAMESPNPTAFLERMQATEAEIDYFQGQHGNITHVRQQVLERLASTPAPTPRLI